MRSQVISSRIVPIVLLLLLVLLAACGQSGTSTTASSTATPTPTTASIPALTMDAYGKPITFPTTAPQHIISLVPTMSDILGALHLQGRVVGVDGYTNYPPALASLPKVSQGFTYNVEKIVSLKPDLILSYGQDTKQYDTQLTNLNLHVVDLPSGNLSELLQIIMTVGRLTLTPDNATSVVNAMQQKISSIKSAVAGTTAPKVMIELDDSTPGKPYVYGGSSYGDELIQDANGQNIFHNDTSGGGYPQVTDEAIISANPQFIILTEPPAYGGDVNAVYKRPNWSTIDALKMHYVYRINNNLIGHPGPRNIDALQCIAQIIHPDKFSSQLPADCMGTV